MVYENKRPDVAVFIDFENVYVSVRDKLDANPNFESIMDRCDDLGRVVIARAYADWYRYPRVTSALYANGIEPMYVPTYYYDKEMGRTGRAIKNSVDMNLCIDAMKTLFTNQNIEKFVLATGDRDFIPLVNSIRQQGKEVIIIGIGGAASAHLAQSADEFIFYEQLVGKAVPPQTNGRQRSRAPEQARSIGEQLHSETGKPAEPVPSAEPDVYDTLVDAVHLVRKRGYVSTLGSLKLVMKELMGGDFKESRYRDLNGRPFAKFKDFVMDAERRGKVTIFTSGTVNEVFLPGEDPLKLSQFAADLKEEPATETFDETAAVDTDNGQARRSKQSTPSKDTPEEVSPLPPPASTGRRRRRRSRSQRKAAQAEAQAAEAAAREEAARAAEAAAREEAARAAEAEAEDIEVAEEPVTIVPAEALSDEAIWALLQDSDLRSLFNVSEALTLAGSEHQMEAFFSELPAEAAPEETEAEKTSWETHAEEHPTGEFVPEHEEHAPEGMETPPAETDEIAAITAMPEAAPPQEDAGEPLAEEHPATEHAPEQEKQAPESAPPQEHTGEPPTEEQLAIEFTPEHGEHASEATPPEAYTEEHPAEHPAVEQPPEHLEHAPEVYAEEPPTVEHPPEPVEHAPEGMEAAPTDEAAAVAAMPEAAPPQEDAGEPAAEEQPAPEDAGPGEEQPAAAPPPEHAEHAPEDAGAGEEQPAATPPPEHAEHAPEDAGPGEEQPAATPPPEHAEHAPEQPVEPAPAAPEAETTKADTTEEDEEANEPQIYFSDNEWQAFSTMMADFTKPVSFAQIFDSLRELRKQEALARTNEQLRTMVKQAINKGLLERSGRGKRVYYKLKQNGEAEAETEGE